MDTCPPIPYGCQGVPGAGAGVDFFECQLGDGTWGNSPFPLADVVLFGIRWHPSHQTPPPIAWDRTWFVITARPAGTPASSYLTPYGTILGQPAWLWVDLGGPGSWVPTATGWEARVGGLPPWAYLPGFDGQATVQSILVHEGSGGSVAIASVPVSL